MIKEVRCFFKDYYSFVNIDELTDSQIEEFMSTDQVKGLPFSVQMELLFEHIVKQGLARVEE